MPKSKDKKKSEVDEFVLSKTENYIEKGGEEEDKENQKGMSLLDLFRKRGGQSAKRV